MIKICLSLPVASPCEAHLGRVPKDLFEEAQERIFEELDYEEFTEEQCIMKIKEVL